MFKIPTPSIIEPKIFKNYPFIKKLANKGKILKIINISPKLTNKFLKLNENFYKILIDNQNLALKVCFLKIY